ncbi:MAG: topoisomerase DNA-binding C4 zinc finger domain-containing protein, partial [Betaproteobacteria bacterium]|nr:topoisomerase DNA-binding C4 zinc finger domain-containing protein [Betaproteobacteria bacterium]
LRLEKRVKPVLEVVGACPKCKGDLVVKKARTGSRFIACSNYPACEYAAPFSTGVPCPREGCDGELVEKSSKKGKIFYSCNRYPACDFALWDWPVRGICPLCASPVLVEKNTKARGKHVACPNKGCRFVLKDEEDEKEPS